MQNSYRREKSDKVGFEKRTFLKTKVFINLKRIIYYGDLK